MKLTIDADSVQNGQGSADLVGFGPIGIRQANEIMCDSTITPIVVERNGKLLKARSVKRAMRLASKAQRTAIEVQQHDECAAPGCHAPIVHLHHVIWWSKGGKTTLKNLIGLCPRCHRAVHAGTLIIDPATHEFRTNKGLRLAGADPSDRPRRRLRPEPVKPVQYRSAVSRT